jgi:neutral ceramidase
MGGLVQLVAGTSAVVLPARVGAPMMGYGAREGPAEALHDPLHARALYVRGASDVLIIACELCLIAPSQADAVRAALAARTGVAAERILVACTHTHSGPDSGFAALLGGRELPTDAEALMDGAVEAGARAVDAALPARLGVGRAQAWIGRNRSRENGPLDPDILVVRVDREDGRPLALLYVHGCHPTVLGHENRAYSADWPGASARAIAERHCGANAIFLLGAHADIDPRTRGIQDLAVEGRSLGAGFDRVEELGREVGLAVAEAAEKIETRRDAAVGARSRRLELATHAPSDAERRAALRAVGLPEDAEPGTQELYRLEREQTRELSGAERRERIARVRLYLRGRTAARFAFGERPRVEAQVLRLGPARLLGLPAEATTEVGLDWKRRCGAPAAVLSIANGWLRYLPHSKSYAEPGAHQRYEILQAALVEEAAERLLQAGEGLDQALSRELHA